MQSLQFYRVVKGLAEIHFLFHTNVLQSTLSHANKTTKDCIQFLNTFVRFERINYCQNKK